MKFKYIGMLSGLILMSGCNNPLSDEKESLSNSQPQEISSIQSQTEKTSIEIPEIVESEIIQPLGTMPSEEEIFQLLNDFSISKISVWEIADPYGYEVVIEPENPSLLTLEEYNVNAWNIIDKIYSGSDFADVSKVNVRVRTETIPAYHSVTVNSETFSHLKSTDFEIENLSRVADRININDKLKFPDAPESDFDRKGNYKPTDNMTKQEIEDEVQDMMFEDYWN